MRYIIRNVSTMSGSAIRGETIFLKKEQNMIPFQKSFESVTKVEMELMELTS